MNHGNDEIWTKNPLTPKGNIIATLYGQNGSVFIAKSRVAFVLSGINSSEIFEFWRVVFDYVVNKLSYPDHFLNHLPHLN